MVLTPGLPDSLRHDDIDVDHPAISNLWTSIAYALAPPNVHGFDVLPYLPDIIAAACGIPADTSIEILYVSVEFAKPTVVVMAGLYTTLWWSSPILPKAVMVGDMPVLKSARSPRWTRHRPAGRASQRT